MYLVIGAPSASKVTSLGECLSLRGTVRDVYFGNEVVENVDSIWVKIVYSGPPRPLLVNLATKSLIDCSNPTLDDLYKNVFGTSLYLPSSIVVPLS